MKTSAQCKTPCNILSMVKTQDIHRALLQAIIYCTYHQPQLTGGTLNPIHLALLNLHGDLRNFNDTEVLTLDEVETVFQGTASIYVCTIQKFYSKETFMEE